MRDFRRKTSRKTIDTGTDDQAVNFTVFHIGLCFREDAADLFSIVIDVVHPFYIRFQAADFLYGAADRDSSRHGDKR